MSRFRAAVVSVAGLAILVLGVAFCIAQPKVQEVCNGAPYPVDAYVAFGNDPIGYVRHSALSAGECQPFKGLRFSSMFWMKPSVEVFVRSKSDSKFLQYYRLALHEAPPSDVVAMSAGDLPYCIRDREFQLLNKPKKDGHCDEQQTFAHFFATSGATYDFIPPPVEWLLPEKGTLAGDDRQHLLSWARDLSQALDKIGIYEAQYAGRPFPFDLGVHWDENDDPINRGVRITKVIPTLIDGRSNPLRDGDVIVRIDGHPVFSVADATARFIERSADQERTIEDLVNLEIAREGTSQVLTISTMYFFNEGFLVRNNSEVSAAVRSAIASFFYGGDSTTICAGKIGLVWASNTVNWLADALDTISKTNDFEPTYLKAPEFKQCRWVEIHQKFALQQMERGVYDLWQVIPLPFAAPIRAVGERPLKRYIARRLGQRALAQVGTMVALEVVETAVWSYGNRSPMTSRAELLQDLKKTIPIAVGGSVGLSMFAKAAK